MTLPHTIPLVPLLDPGHNPVRALRVAVVGAGGIGARVLPTLVKMLPGTNTTVQVFDPDIVEPKNIRRQPFGPEQVGEYKAVVMQDRYSTPDLPVTAITSKFSPTALEHEGHGCPLVILGCVDNSRARWEMLSHACGRGGTVIYLDAGNDGNRGQVIIAMGKGPVMRNAVNRDGFAMVTAVDKFPEVFEPEDPKPEGCDLLDTQTPMANQMAATFLLQYLSLYLHGQLLGSSGVTFTTLGAIDRIPLTRLKSRTGFAEFTARTESYPKALSSTYLSTWLPSYVRDAWDVRVAADALAAKTKAVPVNPPMTADEVMAAIANPVPVLRILSGPTHDADGEEIDPDDYEGDTPGL